MASFQRLTKPGFDKITAVDQFPRAYARIWTVAWLSRKTGGIFVIRTPHVAT